MAFNAETNPPEFITFDDQDVACEVEIDTFDEDNVEYQEEELVEEEQIYEEEEEAPGTSEGYEEQYYEEVVDPNHVYLYDESTSQIHQLNNHQSQNAQEELDVVDYVEDVGPSTSSGGPSTSRMLTSSTSSTAYTLPEVPRRTHPNTYYIRKGTSRTSQKEGEVGVPMYGDVAFHTTYTESISRRGTRVIKRTHTLTNDELDTILDDSGVMRKIQKELTVLKKSNDEMKKKYEEVHRRHESLGMVLAEAKLKHKEALEEKRHLQRAITVARQNNNQLTKKVQPPSTSGVYRYPPHRNN